MKEKEVVGFQGGKVMCFSSINDAAVKTGLHRQTVHKLIESGGTSKGWSFDYPIEGVSYEMS